jgi:hypothetical protein
VDLDRLILIHHAMQRLLEPLPVVVPYAPRLARLIDDTSLQVRRAFPHLLRMVQACALLHQFQRQRDSDGRLVASPADYRKARKLLEEPLAKSLGSRLSPSARRFFDRLRGLADGSSNFSTREAAKFDRTNGSERSVRSWLNELHEASVIEQVSEGRGNTPAVWRLASDAPDRVREAVCPIPTPRQVFGRQEDRLAGNR